MLQLINCSLGARSAQKLDRASPKPNSRVELLVLQGPFSSFLTSLRGRYGDKACKMAMIEKLLIKGKNNATPPTRAILLVYPLSYLKSFPLHDNHHPPLRDPIILARQRGLDFLPEAPYAHRWAKWRRKDGSSPRISLSSLFLPHISSFLCNLNPLT